MELSGLCPQQFCCCCCKTTEPSRGTREYSCFDLNHAMQDQLLSQGEKISKSIVVNIAGHFTFLNTETNDNTDDLLLQSLEKLAPEKLPLP